MTGNALINSPKALACKGPAPPNATRLKLLGSNPCSMVTKRRAPYLGQCQISIRLPSWRAKTYTVSFEILKIPSAASKRVVPRSSATF